MNRDKQIEEMAKIIGSRAKVEVWSPLKTDEQLAEEIYNAGYRKASEVAREIIDDIINYINENEVEDCESKIGYYVGSYALNDFLNLLKKKYTESSNEIKEGGK